MSEEHKARLLRDLYRYEGRTRLVFAKAGDIVTVGHRSDKVDWLVGCHTAKLVIPLDDGRISTLGEGYDFDFVPD